MNLDNRETKKQLIDASPLESRLFGLNMGRYQITRLNPDLMRDELFSGEYDFVRLTLSPNDPFLQVKLAGLGVPFFIVGIVNRFRTFFEKSFLKPGVNPDLEFELYSGDKREKLRLAIDQCFSNESYVYFEMPLLDQFVTKDQQKRCLSQYFIERLEREPNEYVCWLACLRGKIAGFTITKLKGDRSDSLLAGVMPEFGSEHVYLDMTRFLHRWLPEQGIKCGYSGARVHNVLVQKVLLQEGLVPCGSQLIVLLAPLWGRFKDDLVQPPQQGSSEPEDLVARARQAWPDRPFGGLTYSQYLRVSKSKLQVKMVDFNLFNGNLMVVSNVTDPSGNLVASAWIELK